MYWKLLLLFSLNQTLPPVLGYRTVVLVHGVNSNEGEFHDLKPRIEQAHPGTQVIGLKYSPDAYSLDPLHVQLKSFEELIQTVLSGVEDDIHLVCHSQGGVVCMGYIMFNMNPRVHTFMALSSPIFGQYGLTQAIIDIVPELQPFVGLADEIVTEVLYTYDFQNSLSIANYWRDPRPTVQEKYDRVALYLPLIHNDPSSHLYNETEALQRKKNFLSLKKLVLFGGPDDEIIKPWQSSLFGYFAEEASPNDIVNMTDQKIYKDDWIGLRTLDKSGRLVRYTVPGIRHNGWVDDENIFKDYIIQWLV